MYGEGCVKDETISLKIFASVLNVDYYVDILSSKFSEIKKAAGKKFKLMFDNDLKQINKSNWLLKEQKS